MPSRSSFICIQHCNAFTSHPTWWFQCDAEELNRQFRPDTLQCSHLSAHHQRYKKGTNKTQNVELTDASAISSKMPIIVCFQKKNNLSSQDFCLLHLFALSVKHTFLFANGFSFFFASDDGLSSSFVHRLQSLCTEISHVFILFTCSIQW